MAAAPINLAEMQNFYSSDSALPVEETLISLRETMLATMSNSLEQAKAGNNYTIDSMFISLVNISDEMVWLKVMETYIRRGQMTEEKLGFVMNKLGEVRTANIKKMQALQKRMQDDRERSKVKEAVANGAS